MEDLILHFSEIYNNISQQIKSEPTIFWSFIGALFIYVIICSIIGRSNENRAFFYSYTDVSLAYITPIIAICLLFVEKINADSKLFIILFSFIVVAILMFIISYRANQGHIFIAIFTWFGKIVYIFLTVILFIVAIILAGLGAVLAAFIKEQFGRQKYERRAKYNTKEARFAGTALGFGLGMICAMTTFGVKYHDFSLPSKINSKKLVEDSSGSDE